MGESEKGYFKFPVKWNLSAIENGKHRAVVVSIFGKSSLEHCNSKASSLEQIIGKKIFSRCSTYSIPVENNASNLSDLEGYYDHERRIIFLHLLGAYDYNMLLSSLQNMEEMIREKGFLMAWSNLKLAYARSLLVLFSLSHLLLVSHPSHVFDISYIHLFRTLDTIRVKAQNHLGDVLRTVSGIPKDWVAYGRLCSPRVLFLFSSCLLPPQLMQNKCGVRDSNKREGGNNLPALRQLELALEDQIYRLLRKSRVITNISGNSLFALPNNQPYVHILDESQNDSSPLGLIENILKNLCTQSTTEMSQFKIGITKAHNIYEASHLRISKHLDSAEDENKMSQADAVSSSLLDCVSEELNSTNRSFAQFVQQHIDIASEKGFDDNVGRHSGTSFFQVPRASIWFEAANIVYDFFMMTCLDSDNKAKQIVNNLQSLVETEIRFSDARCSKAFPLAVAAYKDGLPSHYTLLHHQQRLEMALTTLSSHARGPMYDDYVGQVEAKCEQIWQDGRIGCEVLSLAGNSCKHARHRTDGKEGLSASGDEGSLPVLSHSSGVVYMTSCNCGHRQCQREDPFTEREANWTFYNEFAEKCCTNLKCFLFPIFFSSDSETEVASTEVSAESSALKTKSQDSKSEISLDPAADIFVPLSTLSLQQSSLGSSINTASGLSHLHTGSLDMITLTNLPTNENEEKLVKRQPSTTEYLPHMLHTASPDGILPHFSSWSLVCLGPSSLYSHNSGICDQPGFVSGTNFLLPWDVSVKVEELESWPSVGDSTGRRSFVHRTKKIRPGDPTNFTVKIFIGVEYECPRGHRFMMSSPDRHLKASASGIVKENANRISNVDMPLYFQCMCSRSGSVIAGQLMRLHIVTPKAPVNVTLNPQVQPSPQPSLTFIPQPTSCPPIKLSPSAYWVLRLPYEYVGEYGPFYPPDPARPDLASYGRLLKGCYGISQC